MIDRKAVASLSIAHLINDWYMNFIQVLLPFMVAAGLGLSAGAFLISAFTITSSISQPVFGYLVDRRNQHWFVYVARSSSVRSAGTPSSARKPWAWP